MEDSPPTHTEEIVETEGEEYEQIETEPTVIDEPPFKRCIYVSERLEMWNLSKLIRHLGTREQCAAFAEKHGLIPAVKMCRHHRKPMRICLKQFSGVGGFICQRYPCNKRISRAKGTWFEQAKISVPQIFYLMYAFAHKFTYDMAQREDFTMEETEQCLSSYTVSKWYGYCREAVVVYQLGLEENSTKIGGPGRIVQIDRSQFGKRKFNQGNNIEGYWVIGMTEDGSEDLRLDMCTNDIDKVEDLAQLLQKHVEFGTILYTDSWSVCNGLENHGFIHRTFEEEGPDNPFISSHNKKTQRQETQWRVVRKCFKKYYCQGENFSNIILEYVWRRKLYMSKKDPFIELIKAIAQVYAK